MAAVRQRETFSLDSWKFWDRRAVTVEFTPQDIDDIERKFTDFLEQRLPELIRTVTADFSRSILVDLKRR